MKNELSKQIIQYSCPFCNKKQEFAKKDLLLELPSKINPGETYKIYTKTDCGELVYLAFNRQSDWDLGIPTVVNKTKFNIYLKKLN